MGGKGGGGSDAPSFVREGSERLSERSGILFDISRPLLERGTQQISSLLQTGGPGARVPIINQAVAAQEAANRQVQRDIGGNFRRAGLQRGPLGTPGGPGPGPGDATTGPVGPGGFQRTSTPFSTRIREQLGRRGARAAAQIPINAAVPLITSAQAGALSSGRLAGAGFQGGVSALAHRFRVLCWSWSRSAQPEAITYNAWSRTRCLNSKKLDSAIEPQRWCRA